MKKLGLLELFKTARMITESGIGASIISVMESHVPIEGEDKTATQIRVGKQMFEVILEHLGNPIVEQWLYDTLVGLTGQKIEDIKALGISDTMDILLEVKEENNLVDFLEKVGRLMSK